jgi:hypothetical protein
MTGPEHYLTAERLLSAARGPQGKADEEWATLLAAQVHATLALAAAAALNDSNQGMPVRDYGIWHVTAGVKGPREDDDD